MKYGMNLLMWTGNVTEAEVPLFERLKQFGYDGVEIPMFEPDEAKFTRLGKHFDDLELGRTAVAVRNEEDNPISSDAAVRAKGVAANKLTLDSCAAAGVEILVGPFHSAIGVFSGAGPTADEWKWGVDSMRQVAEHAETVGVMLAVEPLNRFETYLLNSQADAARFCREVDHPNCRQLYDTFHANIEEKSVTAAIDACADMMCHVHISENDRGTPGQGAVRWDETFDALKKVGYDGWFTVEAFGLALPELVAATKIWRRMYESEDQLARDGLQFMKTEVAKRWK